jgi:hypothetical protein
MDEPAASRRAEVAAHRTGSRGAAPPALAWLVWSFLGATGALLLAGAVILLGVEPGRPYDSWSILLVNAPVFATVGAVLAARRPDHPTGRLPSRRWRWVAGLGAVGLAALMARAGLTPGPSEELLGYRNPFGLTAFPGLPGALGLVEELFYLAELAAVLSLVLRFRQARGVERQQLKWFVYAAVLAVVVLVLANLLFYDLMEHGPLGNLLWGAAPVSLAVAVAVAAATLAVAALFQPARRRVQAAVDRRFDRRRYDAARTVEAFSARLRDELDLESMTGELLGVVDRTVQPAAVSLWLRRGRSAP